MTGHAIPRPSVADHLRLARLAMSDLGGLLDTLVHDWGHAVDVGFGSLRTVFLFGPDANRLILHEQPDNFRWREALSTLLPVNGPTALVVTDGDEHDRRRRLVQPAFARRRVDAHLDLVVEEADRLFETWTTGRRVDAYLEGRRMVRRIVVRSLFGHRLGDQADFIGELLEPALRYVNRNPATRMDIDLRCNGYARAVRARDGVDRLVQAEIDRRRRDGVDATQPDALSALLAERTETGDALTDAEIRDQIRSLIAAGYDTTSSALSWLVYGLGANPTAAARMREQIGDVIGGDPPTVDDLRRLPVVDGVVRETLRLWPPGTVSLRHAVDDFEVLGHRLPAGQMVAYSPYVTHRMEEVWGDPLVFRPERWADGEPVPYSFVPFGGGRRNCLGFALATLELQVFAIRLVQRVRFTVGPAEPRSSAIASFSPTGGMPITVV